MKKILILFGFFAALMLFGACGEDPPLPSESKLETKDVVSQSITPNFMENPEAS